MANRKRGEVEINLGGHDLILRLNMEAICELDDMLIAQKTNTLEMIQDGRLNIGFLRKALLVGLRHNKGCHNLTLTKMAEALEKEIDGKPERLKELQIACMEGIISAFGFKRDSQEETPGPLDGNAAALVEESR